MRGTFKGIEVNRRGGVQAHRWVGSLKLLQDFHYIDKELPDPLRSTFCYFPRKYPPLMNPLLIVCRFYETYQSG